MDAEDRDALTEHSEWLLEQWPTIQRQERFWRASDFVLTALLIAATWLLRDYWYVAFSCGLAVGSTFASSLFRRRAFRRMRTSMEGLSMYVAYHKEEP